MADRIKTIADKSVFDKIFNKFFYNNKIFLKTKNGDLQITYMGYSNGIAAFKIPFVKNITDDCLVFVRSDMNTIHCHLKFQEKQEDDMFLFFVNKFQVIGTVRTEERISLGMNEPSKEGKSVIFITNFISDFIIHNSLALENKKTARVKETILYDMGQGFNFVKLYFANEGLSDPRMNYFYTKKQTIFIPDINSQEIPEKKEQAYRFYLNEIYAKDFMLQKRRELISEVSVPILYKAKLPYGYVQLNNTSPMTESALSIAKRFSTLADELVIKNKIFPQSKEKLIVSNISKKGFGVVFRERQYIRYFKENSYMHLDMLLPTNKKASILAIVKNISILDNKIIQIGCVIAEMDALSEVLYEEFVDSSHY